MEGIRAASPLLTAAVCTVGALHLASKDFDRCYNELLSESAKQCFSKKHNVDDVRGLCVGAFWLSDVSWTLVGNAVRIATELQLHRSIFKALQGSRSHYMRTRVYYLVYVCDHHFSIAYGRPPMTRQCEAVRAADQFLGCEFATEDDARLVSQVDSWSTCAGIFDAFGVDVDRPLTDDMFTPLRKFSIELDRYRNDWTDRFTRNPHVGNYPRKGVGLHYHFAKLYLYSHAFRGIRAGKTAVRSHGTAMELEELCNSAVLSALTILRSVVSDSEVQEYLNGLPTYFDIMIAFAVVFLLKVSMKFSATVRVDGEEIKRLVSELVLVLKRVTAPMHPRHLLVSIAKGIDGLLQRCYPMDNFALPMPAAASLPNADNVLPDTEMLSADMNWNTDMSLDPWFMGEYDLLSSQDISGFTLDFPLDNMPSLE